MISAFSYVVFFCTLMYALRYYIGYVRVKNAKHDIALLNAKIVALKMALRVRIKIKLKSFRDRFAKYIDEGSDLDAALLQLSEIRYERGEDFQRYFDTSKKIIALMKADVRIAAKFAEEDRAQQLSQQTENSTEKASKQLFQEFCGPDFKNEIALVRVIKEITDTTNKLNRKIQNFNEEQKHKKKFRPIQDVPTIHFQVLEDINVIFKDSEILLKEIQASKSEFFINAA